MDNDHWIKRDEAARVLHCSVALVRWFERHGRIHARRDDRGVVSYARTEVAALARLRAARGTPTRRGDREVLRETVSGEIAAQVFALFKLGVPLDEIVIKAKCSPEKVRALYLEYMTPVELPSPAEIERTRERLAKSIAPFRARGGAMNEADHEEGSSFTPRRKAAR